MNNVKMYEAHKEPIRGLRLATLVPRTHQNGLFLAVLVGIVELLKYLLKVALVQQIIFEKVTNGLLKDIVWNEYIYWNSQ